MEVLWNGATTITSRKYVCGHCGNPLASERGYWANVNLGIGWESQAWKIYICHFCHKPTFFDRSGAQAPGQTFGESVSHLPDEVETLYNEARDCISVNAFTASILCSRKLLMNIAVSKGADEGKKFIEYIDYLSGKGYVPPDGKDWVDHIRKIGNEATHEIKIKSPEDAKELISFLEMLLKFVYEFPEIARSKKKP